MVTVDPRYDESQIALCVLVPIQSVLSIAQAVNQFMIIRSATAKGRTRRPVGVIQQWFMIVSLASSLLFCILLIDPFALNGIFSFATLELLYNSMLSFYFVGAVCFIKSAFSVSYCRERLSQSMPAWIARGIYTVPMFYGVASTILCLLRYTDTNGIKIAHSLYWVFAIECVLLITFWNCSIGWLFQAVGSQNQKQTDHQPHSNPVYVVMDKSAQVCCCLSSKPRLNLRRMWFLTIVVNPLAFALIVQAITAATISDQQLPFEPDNFDWRQQFILFCHLLINGLFIWQSWIPFSRQARPTKANPADELGHISPHDSVESPNVTTHSHVFVATAVTQGSPRQPGASLADEHSKGLMGFALASSRGNMQPLIEE